MRKPNNRIITRTKKRYLKEGTNSNTGTAISGAMRYERG